MSREDIEKLERDIARLRDETREKPSLADERRKKNPLVRERATQLPPIDCPGCGVRMTPGEIADSIWGILGPAGEMLTLAYPPGVYFEAVTGRRSAKVKILEPDRGCAGYRCDGCGAVFLPGTR